MLGQAADSEYIETNDRYGKFYLDGPQKASYNVDNLENITFNEPSYKVFVPEKPVLTYHSLKSQIFKYK